MKAGPNTKASSRRNDLVFGRYSPDERGESQSLPETPLDESKKRRHRLHVLSEDMVMIEAWQPRVDSKGDQTELPPPKNNHGFDPKDQKRGLVHKKNKPRLRSRGSKPWFATRGIQLTTPPLFCGGGIPGRWLGSRSDRWSVIFSTEPCTRR